MRVLTANGVTDLDMDALGHVLRIVYLNKVVLYNRAQYMNVMHTSPFFLLRYAEILVKNNSLSSRDMNDNRNKYIVKLPTKDCCILFEFPFGYSS